MVSTRASNSVSIVIREQPDLITLELGEVASEPEVAEAAAGDVEQLVSRFGPRDAAAQLRERAQRAPRRVGVSLLRLHFVAGSDCADSGPDDKHVAGRHQ